MLFIDGCHRFESVINDFQNFETFVNSGGYIVFDDYLDHKHSPQVKKAVDYLVKSQKFNDYEVVGSIPNIQSAPSPIMRKMSNEFILYKYYIHE